MKKALLITLLIFALALSACGTAAKVPEATPTAAPTETPSAETAAPSQTPAGPDYEALYSEVLDSYRNFYLADPSNQTTDYDEDIGYTLDGCSMLTQYVDSVGYALIDLDGDGSDELIIACDDGSGDMPNIVFDLFTLVDGKPQRLLISWERSRGWINADGTVISQGSSSAADSQTCLETLADGKLTVTDCVTSALSSDGSAVEWTCSQGGASPVSISQEEALSVTDGWIAQAYLPTLTPLASR